MKKPVKQKLVKSRWRRRKWLQNSKFGFQADIFEPDENPEKNRKAAHSNR